MEYENVILTHISQMKDSLRDFLIHYEEFYKTISFEKNMLKYDHHKIKRFIFMAMESLRGHDPAIVDELIVKALKHTKEMEKFYNQFTNYKKPNEASQLYIHKDQKFKKHILSQSFSTNLAREEYIKQAQAYYTTQYTIYFNDTKNALHNVLNIQYFILNKLIWTNINHSPNIKEYFKEIKKKGTLSLKTFLEIYVSKLDGGEIKAKDEYENIINYIKSH